jgi:hypothetical protein
MALRLLIVGLVLAGCSNPLGRTMPECEQVGSSMVLAVQSVPESRYVSCIEALQVGWEYQHLTAESGRSSYVLDSDRMGEGFLRVENLPRCDIGDAELHSLPGPGIQLWKDVVSETTLEIVVVPEGPTTLTAERAIEVMRELDDEVIAGRAVIVEPSMSRETTSERIADALASGAHVVVIGIRDVEEGTLGLRLAGTPAERTVEDLDDLIEAIEDAESESTYRGTWSYVFDGGCVRYTFDAEGPGTATLDVDVEAALWLYDAEELRDIARDLGYRLP